MDVDDLKKRSINWEPSDLSPYIFEAVIDGDLLRLRLNDFPDENIATLILQDGQIEMEEFPNHWILPKHRN